MHEPRGPRRRALLLDALGTLVWLEPPADRLRVELARRCGVEVSEADVARAIAAEIAFYRAHLDEGVDDVSLGELRSRCAEVIRDALPASDALGAVPRAELTDALLAALSFQAFPDVRPALERWRGLGLRLVVVSNWDVSLHEVLDRLGIAPLLDAVLTSAEAASRKPAREIFERALELAGVAPEDALHVGDSLEEDIAGARSAGIAAVLIRRVRDAGAGGPAPAGVPVITSLRELEGLSALT